jgi:hypothetical protein
MLLIANSSKGLLQGTNSNWTLMVRSLGFMTTRLSGYILSMSDFTPNKIHRF